MATYVVLSNYTEQGFRNIKDVLQRVEAFHKAAKEAGVTVKEMLWTHGQYDLVTIFEAADETAFIGLALSVAKLGNLRGQTLRAFTAKEMGAILEKVA